MRITKKKKLLIVIALVVAVLTTSISILITSLNKRTNSGGTITNPDLKPIEYSVDVKSKFNRNLMIYIKQFINLDNVNGIGDVLLDSFSKSYISVKKINDLGNYLLTSKIDQKEMEDFFLTFGSIDEDGNFTPFEDAEILFAQELIKLPVIFKNILLEVGFTRNEYSSVCYELILANSSEEYRKALFIAPKNDVILLFSSGLELFEIFSEFSENVKNEVIADSLQEALYEFGFNLQNLFNILGENNFSTLLGLNFHRNTENLAGKDKLMAEEVNKTLNLLREIVKYTINVSTEFMTSLPKKTISGFLPIKYPDIGIDYLQSEQFKYLSYLHIIKTFNNALNNNLNEKVPSVLAFKNKLSVLFTQIIKLDDISNNATQDYIALEKELNNEFSKHFNEIDDISKKYASINDYNTIKTLSTTEFASLKKQVDSTINFAPIITDNVKSVFEFIMVNIYNSISDAYKNIDKKE